MIFMISGSSHTGKTVLAQKLLEQYQYPYLSIDHLKMGLIRSGQTTLTPEDDDQLTEYLWPIVCEMIKTAIENKQNLIVEGCYIPYDYKKDFSGEYLAYIKASWLIFSENYINEHYDDIMAYENAIEKRMHWDYPQELMIQENNQVLKACQQHGCEYVLIQDHYHLKVDMDVVLTTKRLILKRMSEYDFDSVSLILKDEEVMYAWEQRFTDEDVHSWIKKRQAMYALVGYDYFLAIDKMTNEVIGQIGLLDEPVNGEHHIGIGYILKKEHWHKGYATEGAKALIDYAFNELGKQKIIATIRPENIASLKVANRLGMKLESEFVKVHNGKTMPHLVYLLTK